MKKISNNTIRDLESQNKDSQNKKNTSNILAIDYGKKISGLAFSPDGICTFPLKIINTEKLLDKVKEIVNEKHIQLIVLGLPLLPDGSENELCKEIRDLDMKLKEIAATVFINERYSSKNVISPSKKGRIDDLAAAQILEFYFSKK